METTAANAQDIEWGEATTVIRLNYPSLVVYWLDPGRTVTLVVTRDEVFYAYG